VKRLAIFAAATTLLALAVITAVKGRPDKALESPDTNSFGQSQRDSIQQFWLHYRAATRHRVSGELREAAAEYAQALELNHRHRDALYYLGNVRFELGEFRKAEQTWNELAAMDPPSSRVFQRLGDLYFCFDAKESFDTTRARSAFAKALEINSEETGPLLSLGKLALVRGELDTALYYLDAVTATNYQSVPAYFFKGYIAWEHGEIESATDMFRTAASFYEPYQPSTGASSEGDTESGRALLAQTGQCRSFHSFAEDLPDPEGPNLYDTMQQRYSRLAAFLERARQLSDI
jgi:tetratricopeptide (TPR) repeat protein